ncbi:MAG: hypothetical protein R3D71_00960 [Rickettsiales bacterium]
MTSYKYSKGSVIDEIDFQKTAGGDYRAYLHAKDGTSGKILSDISHSIIKRGWQAVPFTKDGKHTLEIRGFDFEGQLKKELGKNHWINGSPEKIEDKKETSSFIDQIKKQSLFLSGLAYIVGDISFIQYGKKSKSPLDVLAGAAYSGGTWSSLLFARKGMDDLHVKELSGRMANYMASQNIEIPDNCSISAITEDKHKGLIKTADDFFRRYPSEMMNGFFALAGASIAAAAMKNKVYGKPSKITVSEVLQKKKSDFMKASPNLTDAQYSNMAYEQAKKDLKYAGKLDVGLGLTTLSSGIFGITVDEEARDPDVPRKKGLEGVWEWVKERPLAITGVGLMVSTMFHAVSTMSEWKKGGSDVKKTIAWRGLFVAASILAEVLVTISSKGHGKGVVGDKSVKDTAISLAGEMIAKQPPAKHEYLIDYMSGFLGRDDVLAMKDSEVKDLLRTQVEAARNNPWAKCKMPNIIPELPSSDVAARPIDKNGKWQTVINAQSLQQTSNGQSFSSV